MPSFLTKFSETKLRTILSDLGDTVNTKKHSKKELVEQILEYGYQNYCDVLDIDDLRTAMTHYKLKHTNRTRQTTLVKRLKEHLNDGSSTERIDGSEGNTYVIRIVNQSYTCTCPDYEFRRAPVGEFCKHIEKLKEKIGSLGGFTDEAESASQEVVKGKAHCLLFGNSAYENAALTNPSYDAKALGKVFKSQGHKTSVVVDATHKEMEKAITKFEKQIKPSVGVVFYFSGHGCEVGGSPYVMPIESTGGSRSGASQYGINVDEVVNKFADAAFRIVILDACRSRINTRLTSNQNTETIQDTLMWFATSPAKVAYDSNTPGALSPFTRSVVQRMDSSDTILEIIMKVQFDLVNNKANQLPWYSSTMTRNWKPKIKK